MSLTIANQYIKARLAGDNNTVLSLVTDDIHFCHQRDGEKDGKREFAKYLETTEPQGTWSNAVLQNDETVTITGKVKLMGFISIPVKATFEFRGDLINKISTKRD